MLNKDWGTTFAASFAYYNPTHVRHRVLTGSSGTNTLVAEPDYRNILAYDYDMIDIILSLDNKRLAGFEIGSGLWLDLIYNRTAPDDNLGIGTGVYLGDKKFKNQGNWRVYGMFLWVEKDAEMDILPDVSGLVGFTPNGTPANGGTNRYGMKCGVGYALLKNTFLELTYYWQKPIKDAVMSSGTEYHGAYQVGQVDLSVKF